MQKNFISSLVLRKIKCNFSGISIWNNAKAPDEEFLENTAGWIKFLEKSLQITHMKKKKW